ncbi:MAG: penicillin-binding protein 2 [Actinobacteria bacterium]|nr:penicillin-binding protein 2 [Actinomycetota bacterium]
MREGLRLGTIGLVFVAMFTVLGARLWFVQVAAAPDYERQAENLLVAFRTLPAPRGSIIDRSGTTIVASKFAPGIVVDRIMIPADIEDSIVQQLSGLMGIPAVSIWSAFDDAGSAGVVHLGTVDTDIAYYVWEHQSQLPGVTIEEIPERRYPQGALAGHIVGYTGKPSASQLQADENLDPNAIIGKGGLEASYDKWLQGEEGSEAYQTNARGSILKELLRQPAQPGDTLHLNLDLDVERVVEQALHDAINLANQLKHEKGSYNGLARKAVAVVMDVTNGGVIAMDSVPEFDPALLRQVSSKQLESLVRNGEFSYNNLAISGQYPPASTFKAVTYLTAVEEGMYPEGVTGPNDRTECSAQLKAPFTDGSTQVWKNWTYPRDDGFQNLHEAFARSCNVYFWEIALRIWDRYKGTDKENLLQDWARRLGFGARTGIDLPGEQDGLIPDRALFEKRKETQLKNPGLRLLDESRLTTASPWFGGDLLAMATGQGALLTTPLQMAVAYAALVNGGTVWKPRVVDRITDVDGREVMSNPPEVVRSLDIAPSIVQMLREDMRRVTNQGTARSAFASMGSKSVLVGGKTGTAQMPKVCAEKDVDGKCIRLRDADVTSWFVGVAPIDDPKYVVVVMVEEGGGGSQVAAPAARFIFQHLLGLEPTPIIAGERTEY